MRQGKRKHAMGSYQKSNCILERYFKSANTGIPDRLTRKAALWTTISVLRTHGIPGASTNAKATLSDIVQSVNDGNAS